MSSFADASAVSKISSIGKVMREGTANTTAYEDPYFLVFSRLFEGAGQVGIDDDIADGTHVGWLNFDRLPFIFVPQFLYPAKLPLADGWERLTKDHGYVYSNMTACPFTFLADSYERFGIPGVIGFHFAAGFILVCIGRLILAIRWRLLSLLILVNFAKAALLIYSASVLEFINAVFYSFLRDTLIIGIIFVIGWYLQGSRPAKVRSVSTSRQKSAGPRNFDSTGVH